MYINTPLVSWILHIKLKIEHQNQKLKLICRWTFYHGIRVSFYIGLLCVCGLTFVKLHMLFLIQFTHENGYTSISRHLSMIFIHFL